MLVAVAVYSIESNKCTCSPDTFQMAVTTQKSVMLPSLAIPYTAFPHWWQVMATGNNIHNEQRDPVRYRVPLLVPEKNTLVYTTQIRLVSVFINVIFTTTRASHNAFSVGSFFRTVNRGFVISRRGFFFLHGGL